jgi:hypothetical protein
MKIEKDWMDHSKDKVICFQCKDPFVLGDNHVEIWNDSGLCPKCFGTAMESLHDCPNCSTDGMEIGEIRYVTLSGQEHKVSESFKLHGMSALWNAQKGIPTFHDSNNRLLDEAHSIMSAVLYGTIKRRDK